MIHYKCEGCKNLVESTCKPHWESGKVGMYESLNGVDCKLLDGNNILYSVLFYVYSDGKEECLDSHVVKNSREGLEIFVDVMKDGIKERYAEYEDFKITYIAINPLIHKDGYYIELKKIEY